MEKKYTEAEITILAQSAIGKTFGELQDTNVKTMKKYENDEEERKYNKAYFGRIFENDVYKYIEHILKEQNPLFGCTNVSQKERILLISKITSFERIEKDY